MSEADKPFGLACNEGLGAAGDARRLQVATELLSRCEAGFSAFVNGRKMARKDRDALRSEIAQFLLEEQRRLAAICDDYAEKFPLDARNARANRRAARVLADAIRCA